MKQLYTFLAVLLCCLHAGAYDPDSGYVHRVGNYIYQIETSGGAETGFVKMVDVKPGYVPSGEVTIPGSATINGTRYVVNTIGEAYDKEKWFEGDRVFKDFPDITRVNIPSTIEHIGHMEFLGCTGINEFHVNANNVYFKDIDGVLMDRYDADSPWRLFRMPPARPKTRYTIPEEVCDIQRCAFAENKTITQLVLHPDVFFNDALWAWGNTKIRDIDVSNCPKYISDGGVIFSRYTYGRRLVTCPPGLKMDSYTVPDDCLELCNGAFCYSRIPEVIIHEKADIGGHLFAGSAIKSLTIHASSLSPVIGSPGMCALCPELESFTLTGESDEPVILSRYSFAMCPKLKSVNLQSAKVSIRDGAFMGCTALTDFPWEQVAAMEGGEDDSYWMGYQFADSGLTAVNWPAGIYQVPGGCFENCAALTQVNLYPSGEAESTLRVIGSEAFRNCTALESINLGALTQLWSNAFTGQYLKKIIIPARATDSPALYYGVAFEYDEHTRIYMDTSNVEFSSAYTSRNNVPGIFITSQLAETHAGIRWRHMYCPAGMSNWFMQSGGGPVTEMFSLKRSATEATVEVQQTPESVSDIEFELLAVRIAGREAVLGEDGAYHAPGAGPAMDSEITLHYTVDGVPMTTTYPADFVITGVESIPAPTRDVLSIHTLSGLNADTSTEALPKGIYIVRYSDGSVARIAR